MKRPSFQFYPGDWAANPNLKRCTFAEKGIWLEVMCLMHDQPEYGVLRWPLKEVAEAVKCRPADLLALQRKGVLKGADQQLDEPFVYVPRSGRKDGEPVTLLATQAGPIWYSSRMVKDEHVRTIRGEGTRFGDGNGDAPKAAPKPPLGDGPSSPSSSPPSGKEIPPAPRVPPWQPPAWMPGPQWQAFVSMRRAKGKRAPFTDEARDGIVSALSKLRDAGHDVGAVLQESVNNGWSGVFAPKVVPLAKRPPDDLDSMFSRGRA